MESRLLNLKNDFNNLINIRNNVKNIFEILQSRIDKLKFLYSEFINSNKSQIFVFGLDSFHFQSKLIDIEYDDMKRLFLAISNRMYCEYFKLNKIIIEYILNNINDKKITDMIKINNYPIYKDLEPFKEYKFETLMDIHENILKMLTIIVSELNNKENELSIHKTKQHIGLNIDNFVTTFNFNNNVMRERIVMFITYIEFFHKLHTKYLKRFSNKIQLLYTDINNDIKFDETLEINTPTGIKKQGSYARDDTNIDNQSTIFLEPNINNIKSLDYNEEIIRKNSFSCLSDSSSSIGSKLTKSKSVKSFKSDAIKIINSNFISTRLHNSKNSILNEIEKHVSDEEMNELFLNIESSCDSIINKNKVNNELEVINTISSEEIINNPESDNKGDNIEIKIQEKDEIQKEEDEIQKEEDEIQKEETDENNSIKEEPKKKRTYKPRKK